MIAAWMMSIYGVVIFGFGYFGYHEAGSKASLWSGSGFGAALILSAQIMRLKPRAGFYMAVTLLTLLTAVFSYRYIVSEKWMPGMFSILSTGMLLLLCFSVLGKKNQEAC